MLRSNVVRLDYTKANSVKPYWTFLIVKYITQSFNNVFTKNQPSLRSNLIVRGGNQCGRHLVRRGAHKIAQVAACLGQVSALPEKRLLGTGAHALLLLHQSRAVGLQDWFLCST